MNIVERLKDSLEYEYNLSFYDRKHLLEELNRLNNIIDELEEFLNKVVETGASIEQITCKNILNYLQELKENKC